MKILQMKPKKGIFKILPESLDDLWHLYNIIIEKDEVYARTTRNLKVEEQYARPKKGKKISVFLGITVEKVFLDKIQNRLRIHGIVCNAPEKMSIKGSHHTLDATINKPITIIKSNWSKHQIDRLKRASRTLSAPLIVASIDDEEYCIAVLRQYGIEVKSEVRTKLPGKLEVEKRAGAMRRFFKDALVSLREVWIKLRSPIVVIGPGFIKNEFLKYIKREALEVGKSVVDIKGVNSAGIAGINEALRSGIFTKALKHIRIAEEAELMSEVLSRLGKGRRDIAYGLSDAEKASSYGATEKLLVADVIFRELQTEKSKIVHKIMKEVEEMGGKIMVLSTEHEAGIELLSLGGVVALLRFQID